MLTDQDRQKAIHVLTKTRQILLDAVEQTVRVAIGDLMQSA
jgi:hypothetical protein